MPVYFIRAGETAFVKIGFSGDIARRLKIMQAHNPEPLSVIREAPGSRHQEAWFHRYFAVLRTRLEWFRYSDEMLTAVPNGPLGVLAKWMDDNQISQLSFAISSGLAPATVSAFCLGHAPVSRRFADYLERGSNGAMPASMWQDRSAMLHRQPQGS